MKTKITLAIVAAASALALSASAASAQGYYDRHDDRAAVRTGAWTNINQRQAELDRRIEMGIRHGDLTRREARRLRIEFNQIAQLEARYRAGGLNRWERADLDRRFDVLSLKVRGERHDNQYGYGYGPEYRR